MPAIELNEIKNYACRGIDLKILPGELVAILGPNGAGKTTLLDVVAGLTEYEGHVFFDGKSVDREPPQDRKIGYLFQDLVLFPHLDVASNIAYPLKAQGWSAQKIKRRVDELLDLVRIRPLFNRYPAHLSGGEKQRVALARALAPSPNILLLDEPLSSLDLQTSRYLRFELKALHQMLGMTSLYVTHELTEAEEIADKIAVVYDGRIEQFGSPREVFFYPSNEKVASFIGSPNILECEKSRTLGHGLVEVSCGRLTFIAPQEGNSVRRIAILPKDIYISPFPPPGPGVNRFAARILKIKMLPESVRLTVKADRKPLVAEIPHHIFETFDLKIGQKVFLIFKLKKIKTYSDAFYPRVAKIEGAQGKEDAHAFSL